MVRPSVPSKSSQRHTTLRRLILLLLLILALAVSNFDNNASISVNQLLLLKDDEYPNDKADEQTDGPTLKHPQGIPDITRIQSESEDAVSGYRGEVDPVQETIGTIHQESKAQSSINSATGTAIAQPPDAELTPHSSKSSRPGYLMYVLTLQGVDGADESNAHRYDNFKRHWSILCNNTQQAIQQHQQEVSEEIHFHRCPGYLNPEGTRFGYGLSMAYRDCFQWALEHHDQWHADHFNPISHSNDIPYIFLEDDGRLYNSNFCYSDYRNRLLDAAPSDTTVLMLGGHNLFLQDEPGGQVENTDGFGQTGNYDVIPTFRRPRHSAGSYGFVIPKADKVAYMRRKLIKMLNRTFTPEGMVGFFAIDKQFYQYPMLKVYITQPWLVYHEGGLWSNNKDRVRGEYGDGSGQYRWVPGLTGSFRNCSADKKTATTGTLPQSDSMSENSFQEVTVVVSCHSVTLRIPQSLTLLQKSTTSDRMIAAVLSNSSRSSWRSTIRSTWGNPDGFVANNKKGTNHTEVNAFFLVAGSWEEIASEFGEYQDVVWISHVTDAKGASTLTTTFQVASFVKLVNDYLTGLYSYLLRVPDDAYANLPGIQEHLLEYKQKQIGMWGTNCRTGFRPFHLGIPDTEYSDYFFPQYCKGEGYALSQHFVHCAAAHIAETRFVSLDDTYFGLLGERCGLKSSQFLSSSLRAKGNERLLKLNFTTESALKRRHRQQQMFWS